MDDALRKLAQSVQVIRGLHRSANGDVKGYATKGAVTDPLEIAKSVKLVPVGDPKQDVDDYRGSHQAPGRNDNVGAPLHDTTGVYPADLYGPNGLHYYADKNDPIDQESYYHTVRLKGKPNSPVTVYRAVPHEPSSQEKLAKLELDMAAYQKRRKLPKDAGTTNGSQWYDNAYDLREKLRTQPNDNVSSALTINSGDWVTPSRAYAKLHGDSVLRGKYKILRKTVKAKDVFTNGDSINEWGYDPDITKSGGGIIGLAHSIRPVALMKRNYYG